MTSPVVLCAMLENPEFFSNEEIQYAINNCSNLNFQDEYGRSLLMLAVRKNTDDIIQLLIDSGADVNLKNHDGETVLMHTANISIVNILLHAGIDVNAKSKIGETAAVYRLRCYNNVSEEIIHLLISNTNVNNQNDNGITALSLIVRQSASDTRTRIIEYLLDNGADPNIKDIDGDTAIMSANIKYIPTLIKYGANINDRNNYGNNKLWQQFDFDTVVELIKLNIDINNQNNDGYTCLMEFCGKYYVKKYDKCIKFCIDSGANINLQNKDGNTAVHLAIQAKNFELVKYLYSFNPDVTIKNNLGQTATSLISDYITFFSSFLD